MLPFRFLLVVLASLALGFPSAHAQQANTTLGQTDENPDPVFVFNRICYSQVPSVKAISDMALKLAWKSVDRTEVEQFRSYPDPTTLEGWDVQVGERLFRVGLTQAAPPPEMVEGLSGFDKGTATSCSIVLDDQQDAADFMPNMQTLAGKEPVSRDVPEGLLQTTTWAGGNDDIKVFLIAKAPPTGKGGLLNVTILQK
ncbi:hypothetical protein [Ahrensia sp. R2A130]|uniref:hypothetical protein n=1 Tax=Ahrensia sp. R2A130 TaxID=744979 RepID=UPI0001E08431|nr:hypothetical protein [Ahrensia sp. R2A130]EFL88076.1 conserved hypothetical protein [Ahrensia sp. R2A130]